ncbi:pimeloyl-ACP methyl ester carboxylesterase [Streptococcus saliviloxodontae]|uniref:Pimeloyl-ACP methyl ester carboxylesterase n=1 Tax=Streptococcus saliviloxodontae TaxID=1349416 RepID=A0ABS2PLM3_9STRE|nr:pimeloyl-ACP methyl ester carboxylesterase [Streptococcus saliviloxodontae]
MEQPTLIIRPLYDYVISERLFKKLLQRMPYAITEFIRGGHNVIYEFPKLIGSSIARFI